LPSLKSRHNRASAPQIQVPRIRVQGWLRASYDEIADPVEIARERVRQIVITGLKELEEELRIDRGALVEVKLSSGRHSNPWGIRRKRRSSF
jgi:hypothetical protein